MLAPHDDAPARSTRPLSGVVAGNAAELLDIWSRPSACASVRDDPSQAMIVSGGQPISHEGERHARPITVPMITSGVRPWLIDPFAPPLRCGLRAEVEPQSPGVTA